MNPDGKSQLPKILETQQAELLAEWIAEQVTPGAAAGAGSGGGMKETEIREKCGEFLRLLREALEHGGGDINGPQWGPLRQMLSEFSRGQSLRGASPTETATFIFSLKKPLFQRLRQQFSKDGERFADEAWSATELLDQLGLFTTEVHLKAREDVIRRQQQEMLELSTPVVKLFDGILALPIIGTLDSARTQVVMETLLQMIVDTGSAIAIIDITGVPTVDTLTAQHLLKTVTAARLMGAECIVSGIRPQIAQTIVHLGVDLGAVVTKASMADAFMLALKKINASVVRG